MLTLKLYNENKSKIIAADELTVYPVGAGDGNPDTDPSVFEIVVIRDGKAFDSHFVTENETQGWKFAKSNYWKKAFVVNAAGATVGTVVGR